MSNNQEPSAKSDPQDLLALFYAPTEMPCELTQVKSADIPASYCLLLDHEKHMTVTVESFHNSLVNVKVLDVQSTEKFYARKILLTKQSDDQVVQFGIVRLNRELIPAPALEEIESQRTPLGRVLIEQDVMRRVQLDQLWKIEPGSELQKLFGKTTETYGRSARLLVNDESAVELLEIVAPIPRSNC